jgi:integrase
MTGMRIGELLALQWTDLDFENRRLSFAPIAPQAMSRRRRAASSRSIDMFYNAGKRIARAGQDKVAGEARRRVARNAESGCLHAAGTAMDADNVRHRIFYPMVKRARNS